MWCDIGGPSITGNHLYWSPVRVLDIHSQASGISNTTCRNQYGQPFVRDQGGNGVIVSKTPIMPYPMLYISAMPSSYPGPGVGLVALESRHSTRLAEEQT